MKKIKALAILMAMTLTFSMFATAASAAEVTYRTDITAKVGDYTLADFNANLANAEYAALFTFDGLMPDDATSDVTKAAGSTLETGILGADENCVLTLTDGAATIYDYDITGMPEDSTTVKGTTTAFASNQDCMGVAGNGSITLSFNDNAALKPVAIGYFFCIHKGRAATPIANDVTINLSGDSEPVSYTSGSLESDNKSLRFYGYKAPVGEYIKSVTITNTGSNNVLRIDDLCVIYADAQNVEAGVRFYKADASEYVDVYSLKNLTVGDTLRATVSSKKGTGKKIVLAGYNSENQLSSVKVATEGELTVGRGIGKTTLENNKTMKVFIWDKDTLVPAGVNGILE